jgi:hypothetical protein
MRNWIAVLVVALGLTVSGFAQHGSGHGNAGGSTGHMGGTGMGPGASDTARENGHAGNMGSPANNMSKQAPDTALSKSPKLSSNLEKLLPSGMTAQQACSGFKNFGQCVAAIHVSHNLNIPFADLKAKMTGDKSEALGKAIQDLKPDANAKSEAKKGQKQAEQDLNEAGS